MTTGQACSLKDHGITFFDPDVALFDETPQETIEPVFEIVTDENLSRIYAKTVSLRVIWIIGNTPSANDAIFDVSWVSNPTQEIVHDSVPTESIHEVVLLSQGEEYKLLDAGDHHELLSAGDHHELLTAPDDLELLEHMKLSLLTPLDPLEALPQGKNQDDVLEENIQPNNPSQEHTILPAQPMDDVHFSQEIEEDTSNMNHIQDILREWFAAHISSLEDWDQDSPTQDVLLPEIFSELTDSQDKEEPLQWVIPSSTIDKNDSSLSWEKIPSMNWDEAPIWIPFEMLSLIKLWDWTRIIEEIQKWKQGIETAELLLENDKSQLLVEYIEHFYVISEDIILKLLQEGKGFLLLQKVSLLQWASHDALIRLFFENGLAKETIQSIRLFSWATKVSALYLIEHWKVNTVVRNFRLFWDLDTEVAVALIRADEGELIMKHLWNIFRSVDHKAIFEALREHGDRFIIAQHITYFKGLDPNWIAINLL